MRTALPGSVAPNHGRRSSPSLTETEIDHEGKRFIVRAASRPVGSLAWRAAGIAQPPTVRAAAPS